MVIKAMKKVDFTKINNRKEVEDILAQDIESKRIRQFVMKNLYRKERNEFAWRMCLDAIANNKNLLYLLGEGHRIMCWIQICRLLKRPLVSLK